MKKLLACLLLGLVIGCGGCGDPTPPAPRPPIVNTIPVQDVIDLVNKERTKQMVSPLNINKFLMAEADRYAKRMASADTLSHTLDGSLGDRLRRIGTINYNPSTYGENIAWNARNADQAVQMWMESDGHRRNILNPAFEDTGVGISFNSKHQPYYCQIFGKQVKK